MPERPEVPAIGETHRSLIPVSITTADDGKRSTFKFMTGALARDGMIIEPGGVDVEAYRRNPVVLWSHGMDPNQGSVPIGRAENIRQVDDGWAADIVWDEEDAFAQRIASKVKRGFINAVSYGWRTLDAGWEARDGAERYIIRRSEMTEFSPVGIPADAGALVMQRADDAAMTAELARLRAQVQALEARLAPEPATAEPEPVEPEAAPEPRTATPEDVLAALARMAPEIDQSINRALGRA